MKNNLLLKFDLWILIVAVHHIFDGEKIVAFDMLKLFHKNVKDDFAIMLEFWNCFLNRKCKRYCLKYMHCFV